ncbi:MULTISPECIES: CoA transferase [unclassified Methylobacterium]|jgi:crotonobetainyl-CoA:carnitine CoA-transferase CaiB-like acyl-CoA transferase|uniref:CoA transferase n=1 Tax=unclassified Methylobacterium TaxID=2615210 RepID=UPI0013534FD3|nr:CoA transferase [Methylobacterium sp. 2A]MWV25970.1 acyl-CoA transferase [Methylobacterium sp. 2A]
MTAGAHAFAARIWRALDGPSGALDALRVTGTGALPSAFAVSDLAAGSVGAAALALAEVAGWTGPVTVDRRLASFWFATSLRPEGWRVPDPWDPVAGDYETRDGWIRLHTNAPHHRAAAERVLGPQVDRAGMARAVSGWTKAELEEAILAAGGCAAEMRGLAEWAVHPQGRAVAAEPPVQVDPSGDRSGSQSESLWAPRPGRPLAGLRVLDLTRVIAGPVATRFLAAFGADVLRIDPPDWNEAAIEPEMTLGKTCARLDLRRDADRATFERLLAAADVLVHGYRPGALDGLGYGAQARRALAPGLVEVCLDAYGWTGPWAGRRGFDSLVQMSTGIAQAGQDWRQAEKPVPLPVQALDHATGYMMAAAVLRLLARRLADGAGGGARLSLARTAALLVEAGPPEPEPPCPAGVPEDLAPEIEATSWGPARRLRPPVAMVGIPMRWSRAARCLGDDAPEWAADGAAT